MRSLLNCTASAVGFLTVIAVGLSAGAMLTEGAVLVPYWRSLPPQAFLTWYSANATRLFDFFGPLEIASTVLAIVATGWYRFGGRPGSGCFAAATVLMLAVLAAFPLYFRAANDSFAAGTIALDQVASELDHWNLWHWLRTWLGIVAFGATVIGVRGKSA